MERPLVIAPVFAAPTLLSPLTQAADLRDIELRRLLEPTPAELRAEQAGRIYIFDGLYESDIARAMSEQFTRADSMMFIRVKPTPVAPTPDQGGKPTRPRTTRTTGADDTVEGPQRLGVEGPFPS